MSGKSPFETAAALTVLEGPDHDRFFTQETVETICKDMASIHPRLYSVASSPDHPQRSSIREKRGGNMLDIIVKTIPGGCFSDSILLQARPGAQMRLRLTTPDKS